MKSEALQNSTAAENDPASDLWEHVEFQRTETQILRIRCDELAHELALARRLLANFLPLASGEGWPEVMTAVRLPAMDPMFGENSLRFSLDELSRVATRTRFRGWAFAPGLTDCTRAAVTLLFVPVAYSDEPALPHAAATRRQHRPDVADAFAGLDPAPARLECAGFEATVTDLSVASGEYELMLLVTEPGAGAAFQTTGVLLRF